MSKVVFSVFLVSCICSAASAQVTAYSDVGGYDTIQETGSGGAGSRLTFAATQFLQSGKYSGLATVLGGNELLDGSASWADDAFNGANGPHYVEILSVNGSTTAAGVGLTRTIVGTVAATKRLQLEVALPEGLVSPVEYRVRSHWTLAGIFGAANEAGLQGGTAVTADMIQLWNGASYDSYYYQVGGIGGVGWRRLGDLTGDASGTLIRQDQSVLIKRLGAATLPLVVNGWVKTGQASIEIVQGFNFVPNPFTEALTLGSSGLLTGSVASGLASGDETWADQVMIWYGAGYDTFYFQTSGLGGLGWRRVGAQSTDASGTTIQPGSSLIINRKRAEGFTWAISQP